MRNVIQRKMPAHLFAFAFHRGGKKPALIAELVVDRDFGNARLRGNLFNGRSGKTFIKKTLGCCFKDLVTLGRVGRTPGAAPTRWAVMQLFFIRR